MPCNHPLASRQIQSGYNRPCVVFFPSCNGSLKILRQARNGTRIALFSGRFALQQVIDKIDEGDLSPGVQSRWRA